jgi:hypothetical protein
MKFSDHFFSYYLLGKFYPSSNGQFFYIMIFMNSLFILMFLVHYITYKEIIIRLIGLIPPLVFNIIVNIIYKCYRYKHNNILRIDCIYSKNFNRIFIGLVKYTKTKYVNTFEYKLDNINRFIWKR